MSLFVQQHSDISTFNNSDSWVILSPIEQSIKRKIEDIGTPLKDWDIQINYGIKTGYNDAFIISTEKRNEILANCSTEEERKKTAELIRPILRGRDIKRYGYEWDNLWLIATFPSRHYDIEKYQAVKQYLLTFGIERLEQTGATHIINGISIKARKKTTNKWFEVQDSIAYWEDFDKPKIIYMEIQTDNEKEGYPFPCYSYDNGFYIIMNTGYIMTSNYIDIKYILGILNSKLGKFLTKQYVSQLQQRQFRMLAQFVTKFPICYPSKESELLIANLVQQRLETKNLKNEKKIDQKVYELYGLNQEEINFIESQ